MIVALDRLREAAGFLPPEIRRALSQAPDGSLCRSLPRRRVALLWCDVTGFTRYTNELLALRDDGVEELHRLLREHYRDLLTVIAEFGGEPVTFVGDGLLSVWDADANDVRGAVGAALAAGAALSERRLAGIGEFDLNLHVACGEYRTIEVGGRHDQWLRTALGSSLRELRRIARVRAPNRVLLTEEAARFCPPDAATELFGDGSVRVLLRPPKVGRVPGEPPPLPAPEAWPAVVSRVPRYVARWIETIGLQWLAELRPITAVTVALHDFEESGAAAAERLDQIVQVIQEITQGLDGSIAAVFVDEKGASVLITFGTPPDAHSDDPVRSVLAADEISRALEQMGVPSSAGVATARAFCGIVGTDDHRCLLVLGEAPILSSRLAWAAKRGALTDDATMRATSAVIGYDSAPFQVAYKGRDGATQAYLVAPGQVQGDGTRTLAGRASEIGMLQRLWAEAEDDDEGTGVIIEGESGTGKTTLALALRSHVEADGGEFRVETTSSIERQTPYGALRRTIAEAVGVTSGMPLEQRRRSLLETLPEDLHDLAPLLGAVFPTGIEETAFTAELTGNARAAAAEDLVVRLLGRAYSGTRVLLCIDDAHWIDPASRDLILRLREDVPGVMVMLLVQQTGGLDWLDDFVAEGLHRIRLGPLKRDGIAELICGALGAESVADELLDRVETATGGHPFFTSELVASLHAETRIVVENGTAVLSEAGTWDTLALPDTLHGMVLQRLDRPEPAVQLSLRVASVGGAIVPTKLVSDIHPLDLRKSEINRHLLELFRMGFLEPMAAGDRPGYGFTHGIVREVAYSQLPYLQRRMLHGRAAEWLEANSGADRGSRLLELAHHWSAADRAADAIDCLLEESLRLFGQGFAVQAVQVGLQAVRESGLKVPEDAAVLGEELGGNMAWVEQATGGRRPTELLPELSKTDPDAVLKLKALLSTAPFAFQSNQFGMFAWIAAKAMRLALEAGIGAPHALSMYSIVTAAIAGDRARGADWSRAALDLDAAHGGAALPVVGFIDTWFHGHWREPLQASVARNRAAATRALADGDRHYASYNIAGEIVMRAALGQPLDEIIAASKQALTYQLHRNSRVHVTMELQFAKALRGETLDPLSLSCAEVDEEKEIGWVTKSEFVNQIGYYLATRIKLHRHAGDWPGAIGIAAGMQPIRSVIAGQTAEFDAVFHLALARLGQAIEQGAMLDSEAEALAREAEQLSEWHGIQPQNFGRKAAIVTAIRDGLGNDRAAAATRLAGIAAHLGPAHGLQDRALAYEYAARLVPGGDYARMAAEAYEVWGARAVARRLAEALA